MQSPFPPSPFMLFLDKGKILWLVSIELALLWSRNSVMPTPASSRIPTAVDSLFFLFAHFFACLYWHALGINLGNWRCLLENNQSCNGYMRPFHIETQSTYDHCGIYRTPITFNALSTIWLPANIFKINCLLKIGFWRSLARWFVNSLLGGLWYHTGEWEGPIATYGLDAPRLIIFHPSDTFF
jgi:hypothetical protein